MFGYMAAQESEKQNVSLRWVGRISKKSDWGRNRHLPDMAHSKRCAKACWYSKKV